jgi:hypothetical protein
VAKTHIGAVLLHARTLRLKELEYRRRNLLNQRSAVAREIATVNSDIKALKATMREEAA